MDDWQLLHEYTAGNSAGAFEALVARYLHLVHGIAYRETHQHHLAEDVTQAVFALLAQKAKSNSLPEKTVIAGWLFQTTRYAARNAAKMERRRQFHERAAARTTPETQAATMQTDDRLHDLDAALERLAESDRGILLLRYFRQLDYPEISRALGLSEIAARKRAERAVAKLRHSLSTDAATLTPMLAAIGTAATKLKLPDTIAARALSFATGSAVGGAKEPVTLIMKGALKMMFIAKLKTAAAIAAAVVIVGGAGTLTVSQLSAESPKPSAIVTDTSIERQVDSLAQLIRAKQDELDEYRKTNDLPASSLGLAHEYEQLSRVEAALDEARLKSTTTHEALNTQKTTAAATEGASREEIALLNGLEASAQSSDNAVKILTQQYDDRYRHLRDMERRYTRAQRMETELNAIETARTKLYIKMLLKQTAQPQ